MIQTDKKYKKAITDELKERIYVDVKWLSSTS